MFIYIKFVLDIIKKYLIQITFIKLKAKLKTNYINK